MVLVPSMDDEFMGAGTEVLLRYFDRRTYAVSVVRIVDGEDSASVPEDVAQYTIERPDGLEGRVGGSLPDEIRAGYQG